MSTVPVAFGEEVVAGFGGGENSHRLSLLIISHSWGLTEAKYSYLRFLSYNCSSLQHHTL